jgi:hypothetical protein
MSYQDFSTANADCRIFAMIEIDAFLPSIPSAHYPNWRLPKISPKWEMRHNKSLWDRHG